jgi:hypothetical protein
MKLFRFVGEQELKKLLRGERIVPINSHKGRRTTFHDQNVIFFFEMSLGIKYAFEFVSGIVDTYAVVAVEHPFPKRGYGTYADPYGSFFDTMQVDEFALSSYSTHNLIDWRLFSGDYFDVKLGEWERKELKD